LAKRNQLQTGKIYSSDNSTNDKEKERKNDENNSSEAKLM